MYNILWRAVGEIGMPMPSEVSAIGEEVMPDPKLEKRQRRRFSAEQKRRILDEVDAPLDDSNIDRFTAVLKQYIDKTQFIVVTHNKKTMAIADLLLGVSMEQKGISKLISLAFEKATLAHK